MRCKTLAGWLLVCCLTDQWLKQGLPCVCLHMGMCWCVIALKQTGKSPVVVGFVVALRTGSTRLVLCRVGLGVGRGSLRQHLGNTSCL